MNRKLIGLGIILILVSVGLSGCNEKESDVNDDNEKELNEQEEEQEEEEEKYSEFVEWKEETDDWLEMKYSQVLDSGGDEDFDDALYYANQVRENLDLYINECRDFYLVGTLDSARDEYIDYLNELDYAYKEFEFAIENWDIGFVLNGNQHWDKGLEFRISAYTYLDNCNQYIEDWKNE